MTFIIFLSISQKARLFDIKKYCFTSKLNVRTNTDYIQVLMSPFDYDYCLTLCQCIRCILIALQNLIHIILYDKSQDHIVWQSKRSYFFWQSKRPTPIEMAHLRQSRWLMRCGWEHVAWRNRFWIPARYCFFGVIHSTVLQNTFRIECCLLYCAQ